MWNIPQLLLITRSAVGPWIVWRAEFSVNSFADEDRLESSEAKADSRG
jgi:hypothetical protein